MIKLLYFSNLHKEEIGGLNPENYSLDAVFQHFKDYNSQLETNKEKLFIIKDDKLIPYDENLISDGVTIVYSNVVAPDNAYEYARDNGIVYFFHTNEANHRFQPHIHARYSGEEIKVHFKNFRVEGKFKNKQKQKEAISYIKENINELIEEWHKIIKQRY